MLNVIYAYMLVGSVIGLAAIVTYIQTVVWTKIARKFNIIEGVAMTKNEIRNYEAMVEKFWNSVKNTFDESGLETEDIVSWLCVTPEISVGSDPKLYEKWETLHPVVRESIVTRLFPNVIN